MLILIAESKTMTACDTPTGIITADRRPEFDAEANEIMNRLAGLSTAELAAAVRISPALAASLRRMIHDFKDKSTGAPAICAFTGVVFKALGYESLDPAARARAGRDVRIISSLYGLLRPDDIVKAYRFDFTTRLAPDGLSFANYWRQRVTDTLEAEAAHHSDIIDLLPTDAARCIDMARIARRSRVWKVDFAEIGPGGSVKTPDAGRLKRLRGSLLRQILAEGIDNAETLRTLEGENYIAADDGVADGHILFHTAR